MTKQDFIKKWIGWVSYTNREKLTNEMEVDLELVSQALHIHDVVGQSEQLKCDHQPKRYDKKHTSCKKCSSILQMKP